MKSFKEFCKEGLRDTLNVGSPIAPTLGAQILKKFYSQEPKKDQSRVEPSASEIENPSKVNVAKKKTTIYPGYDSYDEYKKSVDAAAGRKVPEKEMGGM